MVDVLQRVDEEGDEGQTETSEQADGSHCNPGQEASAKLKYSGHLAGERRDKITTRGGRGEGGRKL